MPCLLQEISDIVFIRSARHWVCNPLKAQN